MRLKISQYRCVKRILPNVDLDPRSLLTRMIDGGINLSDNLDYLLIETAYSDRTPLSYTEAITGPDKDKWIPSIAKEIQSCFDHGVIKYANAPIGTNILSSKWVFKIKEGPNGDITYKSRLTIRGFTQIQGVDYDETYAPTINFHIMLTLVSLPS